MLVSKQMFTFLKALCSIMTVKGFLRIDADNNKFSQKCFIDLGSLVSAITLMALITITLKLCRQCYKTIFRR